jgi:uncharacterized protein
MRNFLCTLALSLITIWAHAAPPSAESVIKLLELTKVQESVQRMHANLETNIQQFALAANKGQPLSAEQNTALAAGARAGAKVLREKMSWPTLQAIYIEIYQESFSQEDIDGLIAFHSSPAGKAYTEKMPAAMEKTMSKTMALMGPMMEEIRTTTFQAVAETSSKK